MTVGTYLLMFCAMRSLLLRSFFRRSFLWVGSASVEVHGLFVYDRFWLRRLTSLRVRGEDSESPSRSRRACIRLVSRGLSSSITVSTHCKKKASSVLTFGFRRHRGRFCADLPTVGFCEIRSFCLLVWGSYVVHVQRRFTSVHKKGFKGFFGELSSPYTIHHS